MKKFLSLLLIAASLLIFCSCGVTDKKISKNLKEMEEAKEISYTLLEKDSRASIKKEIEDEQYETLKGEIEKGYSVYSKTEDGYSIVLVFEKSADAKAAQKVFEKEIEDEKNTVVKRSGKILIVGTDKLAEKIAK